MTQPSPPTGTVPVHGAVSELLQELSQLPPEAEAALAPVPAAGEVVADRYVVVRVLGRGGFGVVVEARDLKLERPVALKFFRPRTRVAPPDAAVQAEAALVARLAHRNIVPIHDRGTSEAGPFLVLDLLEGEPLSRRMARAPLAPAEAVRIGLGIARGLAHAHVRGVVHRDLKPQNVFLCEDGEPKVLDFGLAHLVSRVAEAQGGTPGWMAPEQQRGEAGDERTDVWALGAILYRGLAGPEPEGARLTVPGAPDLEALLEAMLSPDPAARPRDASHVVEALEPIARRLGGAGTPRVAGGRARVLGAGAVAGVALLAAIGYGVVGHRSPPEQRSVPASPGDGRPVAAVADFVNQTGEAELDALGSLLVTSLEQSQALRVLPRGRALEILRERRNAEVTMVDEVAGREVARLAGARALLLAVIHRFGTHYTVDLRAVDPVKDESLFSAKDTAETREDIPDLIDRLAARALRELVAGEARTPAVGARGLTSNLLAAARYYAGIEDYTAGRYGEATAAFEQAVKLDPEFGAAWIRLAFIRYWTAGGTQELGEARRFADRLPDRERRILDALSATFEQRWDDLRRVASEALARYPDDRDLSDFLGELLWHSWLGGGPEALGALSDDLFGASAARDPTNELATSHLVWRYDLTGRTAQAIPVARIAAERRPTALNLSVLGFAYLENGQVELALEPARRAFELGGTTNWDSVWAYAAVLHRSGRLDEAVEVLSGPTLPAAGAILAGAIDVSRGRVRRAVERVRAAPSSPAGFFAPEDLAAIQRTQATVLPARMGVVDARRLEALRSATPDGQSAARVVAAVLLARAGDLEGARRVDLSKEDPVDQRLAEGVVTCRAGRLEEAARLFGQVGSLRNFLGAGYGGYLWAAQEWGDCLLDAGRAADARERYRSVLEREHGQIDVAWAFVRARLGLAKALAALGDERAALAELEPLIALWQGADRDVPVVNEGRALHARLRRSVATAGAGR